LSKNLQGKYQFFVYLFSSENKKKERIASRQVKLLGNIAKEIKGKGTVA